MMNTGPFERAAYVAAHAILAANLNAPELVCPGARHSYAVDTIANIIKDAFGLDPSDGIERPLMIDWACLDRMQATTSMQDRVEMSQKNLHIPADAALQLTP
jgi:hypothetical protein